MPELPTHEFILRITPPSDTDEQVLEKLYEAGCGGFTYSVCNGIHEMICCRQANSMEEAMQTTIKQVEGVLGVCVMLVVFDLDEPKDLFPLDPFRTLDKAADINLNMSIFCDACGYEYLPMYAKDASGNNSILLYPCPTCTEEAENRAFEKGKRIGYADGRAASLTDKF